jgi:hypothetical protein
MKKLFSIFLLLVCVSFAACDNGGKVGTLFAIKTADDLHFIVENTGNLEDMESDTELQALEHFGDVLMMFESYYTRSGQENYTKTYLLNEKTHKKTFFDDNDNYTIGAGSAVILQDRYEFEWLSSTSQEEYAQTSENKIYLIKRDGALGKTTVLAELKLPLPFIYVSKIDETCFLSQYCVPAQNNDNDSFSALSSVSVTTISGENREIIHEIYEDLAGTTDSKGIMLEKVDFNDDAIWGFGRQLIENKTTFFLYKYDLDGNLLKTTQLNGMNDILKDEQPILFYKTGNFILIRTYETLSNYIIQLDGENTNLLMDGTDGESNFAFNNSILSSEMPYIYFSEEINPGSAIRKDFVPLKAIERSTGRIKKLPIEPNEQYKKLSDISLLHDGDMLVTYQRGNVEEMGVIASDNIQYLVPKETLIKWFEQAEYQQ